MGVFEKARAFCTEFESFEDFSKKMAENRDLLMRAAPAIRGTDADRGPASQKILTGIIETNSALALWLEAHTQCAAKAGIDRDAYFDRSAVRVELERFEALAFGRWEMLATGGAEKKFASVDEYRLAGKVLGIVLAGHNVKGYTPPAVHDDATMRISSNAANMLTEIMDKEGCRSR